jgi:hypothetical protein
MEAEEYYRKAENIWAEGESPFCIANIMHGHAECKRWNILGLYSTPKEEVY